MDHVKKMVVVPQELIERLEGSSNSTSKGPSTGGSQQPPQQRLQNLDAEMHRILNDKQLDVNAKWKLYQQVLQRHLHFASQKRLPYNLPIVDTEMFNERSDEATERTTRALVEEIVETFPKIYKSDARNLLQFLVRRSNLINWDGDYRVYINGEMVPESNIVDILHNIVRVRKNPQVTNGWYEVMSVLKDTKVPSEFIGNPVAMRFLGRSETQHSILTPPPTPAARATSTPVAHRLRSRPTTAVRSERRWEPYTP